MTTTSNPNKICWYVLNHIGNVPYQNMAQKTVDQFNLTENLNLELFAPTYVIREEKAGKVHMKKIRLAYHYVFLRGELDDIKRMCRQDNGFSFLINRGGSERYAIIKDGEMRQFKDIARAYENCLPYYSLDDVDLEDGDIVEVVNGDFPGLIGTFIPKPKSKSGNIILRVDNSWGTIAYDIKISDVRVLEFAHNSTRAYDQIDAFTPQLLKALRLFHTNNDLSQTLKSKISVFCGRMEVVKLSNPKLDAKLLALLSTGNYLLGNIETAQRFKDRFDKLEQSITNIWTKALTELLFAVTQNNVPRLASSMKLIFETEPVSKAQKLLKEEYSYYAAETVIKHCGQAY